MIMTEGQFYGFLTSAIFAIFVFKGVRLYRIIGSLFFWQSLTPVRSGFIDIPLMISFCVFIEIIYNWVSNKPFHKDGKKTPPVN